MTSSENNVPSLSYRSQSLMEDTPLTSSSPSNIPNWRTIPKDCDDYSSYLSQQQRPTWSQEQFDASLQLYNDLMNCTDSYVSPAIQSALNTLDHAYRLYGPQSVVCSFNGGKDAVVILHLLRAAHAKYYNSTTTTTNNPTRPVRPRAVYFNNDDEFQEVVDFLHDSVRRYDLDMIAFEHGVSFSEGLQILVDNNVVLSTPCINNNNNNNNNNKDDDDDDDDVNTVVVPAATTAITTFPMAFVLGTRSSDPNAAGQDHFSPSSHWMPPFMRVNPILRWNYGLVWHFLRLFQLPYCTLYDQGYTSLGTVKDTLPCPALAVNRGDASNSHSHADTVDGVSQNLPQFWPAYMLRDWDQERAGRIKKKSSSSGGKDSKTAASTSAAAAVTSVQPPPPPAASSSSVSLSSSSSMTQSASGLTTVSNIRRVNVTSGGMYPANILPQQNNNNNNNNNDTTEEDEDAYTVQSLGSDDCPNDGRAKRVGILIVGDEILKGMTIDTNTNVAAKALRKECVQLGRVAIVSDNVDEIAKEIGRMRNEVDVIITSGGVGPTHDDVTIQGVAQALERELILHDEMADLLRKKMKNQNDNAQDDTNGTKSTATDDDDDIPSSLTQAQVKMATLPSNAKLRYLSSQDDWPVLQCRNIFVLPGVPQFFEQKIERVAAYLSSQLERSVAYQVILSIDEAAIVDVLNQAVLDHPNVSFGSYPYVNHPEVKTVLTLEGNLVMEETNMTTNDNNNNSTRITPNGSASRNSIMWDRDAVILPKAVRDQNVRLALDDLLRKLPKGSILRVENEDETPFT
ncbi:molybdopterin binding domain containing protein [Nitzschia inconspicua]|uniref:FAD synthase n=1 Tax=Nitzschia inconspicua TaxID=303405 RepID=A0A9K3KG63_9STRA|nr:molybdopterin binding domain containing protein [Nitzschia inconspicua]